MYNQIHTYAFRIINYNTQSKLFKTMCLFKIMTGNNCLNLMCTQQDEVRIGKSNKQITFVYEKNIAFACNKRHTLTFMKDAQNKQNKLTRKKKFVCKIWPLFRSI